MVKGKIVACNINCLVAAVKWTGSQSNRDVWAYVTLLSKKSYTLPNSYNFCPSGKRLILTIESLHLHKPNCKFTRQHNTDNDPSIKFLIATLATKDDSPTTRN